MPISFDAIPSILIITSYGWMSAEAVGEAFIADWIVNSAVSLLKKDLFQFQIFYYLFCEIVFY